MQFHSTPKFHFNQSSFSLKNQQSFYDEVNYCLLTKLRGRRLKKILFTCRFVLVLTFLYLVETNGFNLECTFGNNGWQDVAGKDCVIKNLVVVKANQAVSGVNGKSVVPDPAVKVIKIHLQTVHFMPRGIARCFPNLEILYLAYSQLKSIERNDIIQLGKLKQLHLIANDLEILDGDLFESNPELRVISFFHNKLKFIHASILLPLRKLESADFMVNRCVNTFASNPTAIAALTIELRNQCVPKTIDDFKLINHYFLNRLRLCERSRH